MDAATTGEAISKSSIKNNIFLSPQLNPSHSVSTYALMHCVTNNLYMKQFQVVHRS